MIAWPVLAAACRPCLLSGDSAWVTGEAKASDVLFMRSCQILQGNRGDVDGEGSRRCCTPEVRKWKHTVEPLRLCGLCGCTRAKSTSGSRTFRVHGCKCSGEMRLRCLTVNITRRSLHSLQPNNLEVSLPCGAQSRLQHLSSLKSVSGLSGQLTWYQVSSHDVSSSTYWENDCCRHCCGARRHQCDR